MKEEKSAQLVSGLGLKSGKQVSRNHWGETRSSHKVENVTTRTLQTRAPRGSFEGGSERTSEPNKMRLGSIVVEVLGGKTWLREQPRHRERTLAVACSVGCKTVQSSMEPGTDPILLPVPPQESRVWLSMNAAC